MRCENFMASQVLVIAEDEHDYDARVDRMDEMLEAI
jgi:hypothetical protein